MIIWAATAQIPFCDSNISVENYEIQLAIQNSAEDYEIQLEITKFSCWKEAFSTRYLAAQRSLLLHTSSIVLVVNINSRVLFSTWLLVLLLDKSVAK